MTDTPTPGSDDAVALGCLCPVSDNARGMGWMGGAKDRDGNTLFFFNIGCPMHGHEGLRPEPLGHGVTAEDFGGEG